MSFAGATFYHLWHRPFGALRDLWLDGGPWQRRRSERGRTEMEAAARTLPAWTSATGTPTELHLLSGRRFWYQTAFCLWSFARQSGRPLAPVIYDDGTLIEEHRSQLARLFPAARFVTQAEILARLDTHLPSAKYPTLRERWLHYPNIRKLLDPHVGSTGWKLVLDSDMLFFRRPDFLINWLDSPDRPLHAVDCEESYGYSRTLMESLAGNPMPSQINVGLCGLKSEDLDWEQVEFWTSELIRKEKPHYYLEQALVAMILSGKERAVAPENDYIVLPLPPEARECQAVMHHYVAHSKRWYFQHCWHRSMTPLF